LTDNLKRFIKVLKESKSTNRETKIVTKTVHEVHYKDDHGRWVHHSTYDDKNEAETLGARRARSYAKSMSSGKGMETLNDKPGPPKTPYGD